MSASLTAVIRLAEPRDAEVVARIYNHYVRNSIATFEEEPVTAEDMWSRIEGVLAGSLPWLVAEADGALVGYAYGAQWNRRCAYRMTAETSVYLDPAMRRRGIGEALYRAVLAELAAKKFHTVIGGISLPNEASVRLHEKLGYRKVAHFAEVGFKFNAWIDVGYWQLMMRSASSMRSDEAP